MHSLTIEEAKQRLPLNTLARRLAIPGEIPEQDGKAVSCFWPDRHANGDRKPSFNFHSGLTRFKCFACGIEGDGPDLISHSLGIPEKEAIRKFVEMAGGTLETPHYRPKERKRLIMPKDLSKGSETEWRALAELRRINPEAIELAASNGVLRFGTVKGFPSWLVIDEARKIAEARRMDGQPFPASGTLGERKAHTLAGSDKSWPVGIKTIHLSPENFRKFVICEGGPDVLAAYHFFIEMEEYGTQATTILGRNCRTIHPEALRLFRGKRVRIFPHADKDGGGIEAARRWKREIEEAGDSEVDGFDFSGLLRKDGKPVSDLNDCTVIREDDATELEGLFQ